MATYSQNLNTQFTRYSIDGNSIFIDGYSGARNIVYFAKLPSIVDAPNTNWLLSNFPEVYLYAVGLEAAKYLKDIELVTLTKGLLDDALRSVRIDDERARWSNTTVQIQGPTP